MHELQESLSKQQKRGIVLFFKRLSELNQPLLLKTNLQDEFEAFSSTEDGSCLQKTEFAKTMGYAEEAVVLLPKIYFALRKNIGIWKYCSFNLEENLNYHITVSEFLAAKEQVAESSNHRDAWDFELDLTPFQREFPRLKEVRSIGRGVEFRNRHLSGRLFSDGDSGERSLFEFLRLHKYNGTQLMLNSSITDVGQLRKSLRKAELYLENIPRETKWNDFAKTMQEFGFEPGWGDTADRVLDTFNLLTDILEAVSPDTLEKLLARIPMIFNIAIITPHGYFGQKNVLGLPDTGGQIVYILDQVRALETEMKNRIKQQGLDIEPKILIVTRLIPEAGDTTCNQRIEDVVDTENTKILRVPFRDEDGNDIPHWISRFKVWPYLEQYAIDAEKEICEELDGQPDLIIGNYSDGNLVASLLSQRMGVTQCNIAHALEKTKYLYSALYWRENEEQYHFSSQFSADLIAMNTADFIITSTYQEIAGTRDSIGQYESYNSFSMPGLFRVVKGIDVFDPKFNIVSPGADPRMHFPYFEEDKRNSKLLIKLHDFVFGEDFSKCRGKFTDSTKPIIFLMSRLDTIKNATGFVEWYGENGKLRDQANLLVAGGGIDVSRSSDDEERKQIEMMHEIMDRHELDGNVRWIERQDKENAGELYRLVADIKGIFVQPALFEAFGLTVIEAMVSGLPTFATRYGGPLEIIENGISGFHIDPNKGEQTSQLISDFFERCSEDDGHWLNISQGGIKRVEKRYTWQLYADRLMTLARIYGYWKYTTNLQRQGTQRYLEMFYNLFYKQRAAMVNS